jgi:hypothetical protein
MSEQVLEHLERIARLLATPAFGEESRRRQLNEKFEVLRRMRERNDKLFGTLDQDKGSDRKDSK